MAEENIKTSVAFEYGVEVQLINAPCLVDDFIPSWVTATFSFIEQDQLRPLIDGIHDMDTDATVKIVEYAAPGQERLIFLGHAHECLIDMLKAGATWPADVEAAS